MKGNRKRKGSKASVSFRWARASERVEFSDAEKKHDLCCKHNDHWDEHIGFATCENGGVEEEACRSVVIRQKSSREQQTR